MRVRKRKICVAIASWSGELHTLWDVWLLARRWNNINDLWAITLERMKNRTDSSVEKITSTHSSRALLISLALLLISLHVSITRFLHHYLYFSRSHSLSVSLFNPLFPCLPPTPSFQFIFLLHPLILPSSLTSEVFPFF